MPRIRLIAGPNGAGKTTLLKTLVSNRVPVGQYINPDDIARHINLNSSLEQASSEFVDQAKNPTFSDDYQRYVSVLMAQGIATGLREDWLAYKLSLTYESVMSHESHLEFVDKAVKAGFDPYLYYICTSDPDINKARVEQRVASGGHDVPEAKILSRYYRSLGLLPSMARRCKRVYFFDNSSEQHLHFAEITPDGHLDIFEKQFSQAEPSWFVDSLLKKWPKEKVRIAAL